MIDDAPPPARRQSRSQISRDLTHRAKPSRGAATDAFSPSGEQRPQALGANACAASTSGGGERYPCTNLSDGAGLRWQEVQMPPRAWVILGLAAAAWAVVLLVAWGIRAIGLA